MEIASILGIVAAFGLVGFAIFMGGGLLFFFNAPALLMVLGGTLGATLIHYPLRDLFPLFRRMFKVFFSPRSQMETRIATLVALSARARKEGILSLERIAHETEDPFLAKGLQLAVDGLDVGLIREILETDQGAAGERHEAGAEVFATMGTYAPAMGMVGTLIGLIQMLQQLNNPDAIGSGMAVALLTTFYGALLSNLFFLPMAGKLRALGRQESREREMLVDGLISLIRGENPRVLEWRMRAHGVASSLSRQKK